jgi:beta-glucosidase-like glycosyl hydrolase
LQDLGRLMGDECRAKKAHVLLSPTINLPRTPLSGRAPECLGEDPVLSGTLAGYLIRGIQENGVVATPKHFVCNDQEQGIFSMDVLITQRAMRELYMLPFMLAIKLGNPKAIMVAYNKVNGIHVSESKYLLQNVLREEWKFQGALISDWYTTCPWSRRLLLTYPCRAGSARTASLKPQQQGWIWKCLVLASGGVNGWPMLLRLGRLRLKLLMSECVRC